MGNKEVRVEIIDGQKFRVKTIPTKNPDAVRHEIGERPEGEMGRINKNAKVVGARKG